MDTTVHASWRSIAMGIGAYALVAGGWTRALIVHRRQVLVDPAGELPVLAGDCDDDIAALTGADESVAKLDARHVARIGRGRGDALRVYRVSTSLRGARRRGRAARCWRGVGTARRQGCDRSSQ